MKFKRIVTPTRGMCTGCILHRREWPCGHYKEHLSPSEDCHADYDRYIFIEQPAILNINIKIISLNRLNI